MGENPQKWEGSASAPVYGIEPDRAWSLLGEFFSVHKFLPVCETCNKLDGSDGLVRYCTGSLDGGGGSVHWAKERLLLMDRAGRSYTYEIIESDMGFGCYIATLKVVELEGDDELTDDGCKIVWSFEAEPINCWTQPGSGRFIETNVEEMA